MRILEIISGAFVNGTTQHGLLLTRELARRGHTVTVVCRPQSWIGGELRTDPVEMVESDLRRWPLDELWRIARIVRHHQIEILHTHSSGAHTFGVMLRWLSHVPCIATAHAENRHWHWRFNDRVIAVSEATRHFLLTQTYARRSRIDVIPNFVYPTRFSSVLPHTRTMVRTLFGIPPQSVVLGFVGSLYHGKGWDDLLPAFAQVCEAAPDIRLLAVGDGKPEYRTALRREAMRLGVAEHIIWAGHRNDIPEMLSAIDIFVSPSRQETFGLAVLEAMAAGCPVVAMAVGGLPELVHDKVTGLLVPSGDLVALRHALMTLIQDEPRRRKLGKAGQRRAQECFTPEIQLPRLEEVFVRTRRSR